MQISPPPPPAEHRDAPAAGAAFADSLEDLAAKFPELAFAEAHRIPRADRRDRVLRRAFLTSTTLQRGTALRHLAAVIDSPWIAETAFPDAAAVAALAAPDSPEHARRLLLASALRNPSLAVRQFALYRQLPFAREVLDTAALAAADEAVLLASAQTAAGQALRDSLDASEKPEVRLIAAIALRPGLSEPVRARAATLAPAVARGDFSIAEASAIAASPVRYFAALVNERVAASGDAARGFDRILENYALILCHSYQQSPAAAAADLARFSALDLYLLLAYGRAEQEDTFFTGIFDRVLLPKLRSLPSPRPLSRLIGQTHEIRFRDFAAAAVLFDRWEQFLAVEGAEPDRAALIARLVRGIHSSTRPLDDAVTVSGIFELTSSPERLRLLGAAAEAERLRASSPRASALYSVLSARVQERLSGGASQAAGALETSRLFDSSGLCRQRHYFYYDQDGVSSFQTFLAAYEGDPAWTVEVSAGVARIAGRSPAGRGILIFANEPFDLQDPRHSGRHEEAARRMEEADRLLLASGGEATVIVHRGHSYHVDRTLGHVTRSTGLVFLGSCRGLDKVVPVLETANDAHVFATRGIGTQSVNDPLLKSLNDDLLSGPPTLDWAAFWRRQEARLGRFGHFRDYLPPHRNPASILLRAYYRTLDQTQ